MSSGVETEENTGINETLIFNVGGVIFETYRSTLMRIQGGPLKDNEFLEANHRPDKNDYFFDRDPDAFKILLNYLRTGQVTIPAHIDGPNIRNELVFWGLAPNMEVMVSGDNSWSGSIAGHSTGSHANTDSPLQTVCGSKVWNILSNPDTSMLAKIYAGISYFMMFLSVFILVGETTSLLQNQNENEENFTTGYVLRRTDREHPGVLLGADIVAAVCCLFFSVEYILRIIFAPNKILFIFSFLGIIDFLAILPNFLYIFISNFLVGVTPLLRILTIFKVFRILRLLRIFQHLKVIFGIDVIVRTLYSCFGQLICLFFFTLIVVLFWGALAYYTESFYDGINFESIYHGCWWAIITITTVGYGDIYPEETQGKILASFCALSGVLIIGLLVSVIVTSMVDCSRKMQSIRRKTILKRGQCETVL